MCASDHRGAATIVSVSVEVRKRDINDACSCSEYARKKKQSFTVSVESTVIGLGRTTVPTSKHTAREQRRQELKAREEENDDDVELLYPVRLFFLFFLELETFCRHTT